MFPQALIWTNHFGDTLILAAREPMTLDRARIPEALPLMQEAARMAPGPYDKELQELRAPSRR